MQGTEEHTMESGGLKLGEVPDLGIIHARCSYPILHYIRAVLSLYSILKRT